MMPAAGLEPDWHVKNRVKSTFLSTENVKVINELSMSYQMHFVFSLISDIIAVL